MPQIMRTLIARAALPAVATGALVTVLLAGCGESATPPPPTPPPAPTVAADLHLVEPASAADVFDALLSAGLAISPNNGSGGSDREPREVINATYAGWSLTLSSYSSAEALAEVGGFEADEPPGKGDPPYRLAGLNVLVAYGPSLDGKLPAAPERRFADAAQELGRALTPVIGPLAQSSIEPLQLPAAAADGEGTALSASPAP
jgi:hypothetical protein